jgi:hypothetical protein
MSDPGSDEREPLSMPAILLIIFAVLFSGILVIMFVWG